MRITVSRREWGFALVTALAVAALLQAPYVLGYATARAGTQYSGLLVNLSDVTYYVGIQLGIAGEWLYRIRFTAEPHSGAFLYTFYLALGHVARWLNLDAVTMWHASRMAWSALLLVTSYGFIAYFIREPQRRRVAFFILVLGAGFDFVRFPFEAYEAAGAAPVDLR